MKPPRRPRPWSGPGPQRRRTRQGRLAALRPALDLGVALAGQRYAWLPRSTAPAPRRGKCRGNVTGPRRAVLVDRERRSARAQAARPGGPRGWMIGSVGGPQVVPDHVRTLAGSEHDRRRVILVDVADEPVVHGVADQLL